MYREVLTIGTVKLRTKDMLQRSYGSRTCTLIKIHYRPSSRRCVIIVLVRPPLLTVMRSSSIISRSTACHQRKLWMCSPLCINWKKYKKQSDNSIECYAKTVAIMKKRRGNVVHVVKDQEKVLKPLRDRRDQFEISRDFGPRAEKEAHQTLSVLRSG